jgi:hypothetical protein
VNSGISQPEAQAVAASHPATRATSATRTIDVDDALSRGLGLMARLDEHACTFDAVYLAISSRPLEHRTVQSSGTHAALLCPMTTHLAEPRDGFTTDRSVARVAFVARVARVVDYLFGVLYTLLVVRLALEFFGARRTGFVDLIHDVTDVFYAPFKGILPTDNTLGAHIVWPLVVALFAYMLLHAGIRGLLRLVARG